MTKLILKSKIIENYAFLLPSEISTQKLRNCRKTALNWSQYPNMGNNCEIYQMFRKIMRIFCKKDLRISGTKKCCHYSAIIFMVKPNGKENIVN